MKNKDYAFMMRQVRGRLGGVEQELKTINKKSSPMFHTWTLRSKAIGISSMASFAFTASHKAQDKFVKWFYSEDLKKPTAKDIELKMQGLLAGTS